MKKTDLEKLKALKLGADMRGSPIPNRFAGGTVPDRREQRRRDQEAGLVPFACKLEASLVQELHRLAQEQQQPLDQLLAGLLRAGMAAKGVAEPASGG